MDSFAKINIEQISNNKVIFCLDMSRRRLRMKTKDLVSGLYSVKCLVEHFKINEYCRYHKFDSFAPKRLNNAFTHFVDGEDYFR